MRDQQASGASQATSSGDALLERRLAREISRRKQAEDFAESRTRELFEVNADLRARLLEVDRLQEQLRIDARTDALTGLLNRRGLLEGLSAAFDARLSIHLAYADLVAFKAVNDSRGHSAGDEVLHAIGRRLRSEIRDGDLGARIGGDEFVIGMTSSDGTTLPSPAELLARVTALGDEPIGLRGGGTVRVGLRVGVATALAGDTPETLLFRADRHLILGHASGR